MAKKTSSRPQRASVWLTAASLSDARLTSARMARAWPPASSIAWAVALAASSRTSTTATRAPSRAKRSAEARPIPDPAPVISATRLSSRIAYPL